MKKLHSIIYRGCTALCVVVLICLLFEKMSLAELKNTSNQHKFLDSEPIPKVLVNLDSVGIKCAAFQQGMHWLVISWVVKSSPADQAGIKPKDCIIDFQKTKDNVKLVLERGNYVYKVFLKPAKPATAKSDVDANANGTSEKKEDELLHPFLTAKISQDGSNGVTQTKGISDNWFQVCLAGLAETPRGQKLISDMIVQDKNGSYQVTFPNEQKVIVSANELSKSKLSNKAPWASLLELAYLKMPKSGHAAKSASKPEISRGMELLTGTRIRTTSPSEFSLDQLTGLFDKSVDTGIPIVMATGTIIRQCELMPYQVYTLIAVNQDTGDVTLRDSFGVVQTVPADVLSANLRYIAYPVW